MKGDGKLDNGVERSTVVSTPPYGHQGAGSRRRLVDAVDHFDDEVILVRNAQPQTQVVPVIDQLLNFCR
ncbi:hypothetical protein D3C71_2127100 [compost metagenome]